MRPTDRLLRLDLEAVPALIDALSDKSPTRTVTYSSRFGGGFFVEPMSALARCTLIEIAGSRPEGDAGWREWYARARKGGIRRLVEEGVASLDYAAIRTFLRRWPKDLDFVLTAMRKPGPDAVTADHFELLLASRKGPPDERVLAFCVDRVRQATEWSQLMFMAEVLLDHDHTGGVGPVLAQWRKRVAQEKKPRPDPRVDRRAYEEWSREAGARDELLRFLVGTGDIAAWRAIAEECARPDVRTGLGWRLLQTEWSTARRRVQESDLAEVEAAFRKCLTLLLADDATLGSGLSFSHRGSRVYLHRACCADVAACVLAANWPKEFTFDPACTETVRRRQILALRGTPLPKPAATTPPAETPAEALLRANRVERVALDKSAETLDAAALERIRASKGKPLTAEGLLELVIAAAAMAKHNGVICTCERTGEGNGTSLTIACRPLYGDGVNTVSSGPGGSGGWDVLLLVTARGAQLGDERLGVNSGTLEKVEQLEEHGNYLGAIRKALQSEAGAGVEITFGVQLH